MLVGRPSPDDMNIHPIRYQWAYDLYNQAVRNTWFPHEIDLKEDLDDWQKMTDDERHAVEFLISFFNPAELIVNRSIALGIYPYLKSPECHLYLAKQMWEEANHCVAFEYVLQTFPINRDRAFQMHLEVPSMTAKEEFINKYMRRMTEDTLNDESLHLKFGINLIHNILEENPELVSADFAEEIRGIIVEGVNLETAFNKDLFPRGILGLNADYVNQYVQYVADRRLEELGLGKHYNVTNPAKWMATSTDVFELVNFFEAQNTNYEVDSGSKHK